MFGLRLDGAMSQIGRNRASARSIRQRHALMLHLAADLKVKPLNFRRLGTVRNRRRELQPLTENRARFDDWQCV